MFMKVFLFRVLVCFWTMNVVVSIGRWSEESCFIVIQLVVFVRSVGRMVRSGEVGFCCYWWVGRGSLVGLLSSIMEWVESFMILLMVMPLWSFVRECHEWW